MYQKTENQQLLGSIRLTDDDVQAVIDLWVERRALWEQSTVADVAEGLDITVEEVQALLEEVRARRAQAEAGIAQERERLAEERRLLAEEQARLVVAERRLVHYHIKRSDLHKERMEVRQQLSQKTRHPTRGDQVRGKYAALASQSSISRTPLYRWLLAQSNEEVGLALLLLLFWAGVLVMTAASSSSLYTSIYAVFHVP